MRTLLLFAAYAVLLASPAQAVSMSWVGVGDAGNAADDTGFGSVADPYLISQYEVTSSQYAEFLNAVAEDDTNGLYNTSMNTSVHGGIVRMGGPGNRRYSAKTPFVDKPVIFVSFYDALRFANWMHNGQPTGAQDASTTEDGAYTITQSGIDNNTIVRKGGATIFLTSEDEWYKAAYYNVMTTSYLDYPAGSDVQTSCAAPTATANHASCANKVASLTDVGAYTGSPSPNDSFDQGGNVFEWTEGKISAVRYARGGDFRSSTITDELNASQRMSLDPAGEVDSVGFRIATIPEPASSQLLLGGLLGLAHLARSRRLRA